MQRVLLTRPVQRIGEDNAFSAALISRGVDVVEIPMITIDCPSNSSDLDSYFTRLANKEFDYCVLSSPTAVEYFQSKALNLGLDEAIRKSVLR